jgi:hypothetical protein
MLVNAYPLALTGRIRLWSLIREQDTTRRDMEARTGVALFAEQTRFLAAEQPQGADAEHVEIAASRTDAVVAFAVRTALVEQGRRVGEDAWSFKGEAHCVGLRPPRRLGSFDVTKELVMRVAVEEFAEVPLLVVRRTHRWTWAGSLADPQVQRAAVGAAAVRLSGPGPARGRVVDAGPDRVVLLAGGEEVAVSNADYTVRATSALVAAVGGPNALQAMLVASGSLNAQNRKNRYAVRDRFADAAQLVDTFGRTVALPGGDGQVTVGDDWVRVDEDEA